jgi:hypothetical protein
MTANMATAVLHTAKSHGIVAVAARCRRICRSQRRPPDRLTVLADLTAGLAALNADLRAIRTDIAEVSEVSELRGEMTAFMTELRAMLPPAGPPRTSQVTAAMRTELASIAALQAVFDLAHRKKSWDCCRCCEVQAVLVKGAWVCAAVLYVFQSSTGRRRSGHVARGAFARKHGATNMGTVEGLTLHAGAPSGEMFG